MEKLLKVVLVLVELIIAEFLLLSHACLIKISTAGMYILKIFR